MKLKDYIRTSKFKSFSDNIHTAVNEYFSSNPTIVEGDEEGHCDRILELQKWIKINPTASDIELAKILVRLIYFSLQIDCSLLIMQQIAKRIAEMAHYVSD
jgi:hypothetical protein